MAGRLGGIQALLILSSVAFHHTTGQQLRDQFWGQGIMTWFGRPAKQGDSGLVPQRTILPELEFECCKAIILQLKN